MVRCARDLDATLCAWRRGYTQGGVEALEPKPRRQRRRAPTPSRRHPPEEGRAALDAFEKSGMMQAAIAQLWGVSAAALAAGASRARSEGA